MIGDQNESEARHDHDLDLQATQRRTRNPWIQGHHIPTNHSTIARAQGSQQMKAKAVAIDTPYGVALILKDKYDRNLTQQLLAEKIVKWIHHWSDVEIDIKGVDPKE
jgi:hypothetical protein